MNTSPFSALLEAITKEATEAGKVIIKFCDDLRDYVREIDDARRKEIERLEAEALELANKEANKEAVPFDVMMEELVASCDRADRIIELQRSAMFWDEDARLLEKKMAARHREILRAVEAENARQAMKRRKMLHDDGSFPEWAR